VWPLCIVNFSVPVDTVFQKWMFVVQSLTVRLLIIYAMQLDLLMMQLLVCWLIYFVQDSIFTDITFNNPNCTLSSMLLQLFPTFA